MDATELLQPLLEATIATSLATLLVLVLRRPLRAAFGARVAYAGWALVPMSLFAVVLPAAPASIALPALTPVALAFAPQAIDANAAFGMPDTKVLVAVLWMLGAVAAIGLFAHRQRRFRSGLGQLRQRDEGLQADASAGLPAAMGWWRPAIVLPADFDSRYDASQRALMLAHEHMHIARGDLHANAFAAAVRCLFWFNPLLHFATRRFRHDQELACDACVVAATPTIRRAYGEALLQAQFAAQGIPMGCHFGFGHPLKERIAMLKESLPSPARRASGIALVASLVLGTAFAAWAVQPQVENSVVSTMELKPDTSYVGEIRIPPPAYPKEALEAGASGTVILVIDVGADGNITAVSVESSTTSDHRLDIAAAKNAWDWHFKPEMENGKPVAGRVRVPVTFKASEPKQQQPG